MRTLWVSVGFFSWACLLYAARVAPSLQPGFSKVKSDLSCVVALAPAQSRFSESRSQTALRHLVSTTFRLIQNQRHFPHLVEWDINLFNQNEIVLLSEPTDEASQVLRQLTTETLTALNALDRNLGLDYLRIVHFSYNGNLEGQVFAVQMPNPPPPVVAIPVPSRPRPPARIASHYTCSVRRG